MLLSVFYANLWGSPLSTTYRILILIFKYAVNRLQHFFFFGFNSLVIKEF